MFNRSRQSTLATDSPKVLEHLLITRISDKHLFQPYLCVNSNLLNSFNNLYTNCGSYKHLKTLLIRGGQHVDIIISVLRGVSLRLFFVLTYCDRTSGCVFWVDRFSAKSGNVRSSSVCVSASRLGNGASDMYMFVTRD